MTSSNDTTVVTKIVQLRNLTLHLDVIGIERFNSSNVKGIFGMLLRLEFDDFAGYMSGKVMCDLYLEMDRFVGAFSSFAAYDILFMVSREEFSSGTAGIT